jgi:hypothetical protein
MRRAPAFDARLRSVRAGAVRGAQCMAPSSIREGDQLGCVKAAEEQREHPFIQWSVNRAPPIGLCQSRHFQQATTTRSVPKEDPTRRRYRSFLPAEREPGQPATCIQRLASTNHSNGVPKRRPRRAFLSPATECRSSDSIQCTRHRIRWPLRS